MTQYSSETTQITQCIPVRQVTAETRCSNEMTYISVPTPANVTIYGNEDYEADYRNARRCAAVIYYISMR